MDMAERIMRIDKKRRTLHLIEIGTQLAFVSMYAWMFFFRLIDPTMMMIFPFLTVVAVIFIVTFYGRIRVDIRKKYQKELKSEIIGPILQTKFDNLNFVWEGAVTANQVNDYQLCTPGDSFHTEDYLHGFYRGVEFEQSDVKIVSHSGKHTYTHFDGRMLTFLYPGIKQVNSIKVYTKTFSYSSKLGTTQKISMENEEFNRFFKVYAYDPHEAFYVLTPQVMERLLEIRKSFPNYALHIKNGVVYLGLNQVEDAFDPSIRKPLDYMEIRRKVNRDTDIIKSVIEVLELTHLEEEDQTPKAQEIQNDYYSDPVTEPYYNDSPVDEVPAEDIGTINDNSYYSYND